MLNSGFQLSLELSKVFPIGKGVEIIASQVLGFARDLRKSGSDIVVEEDLNEIFGRGRIVPETEEKFKSLVKIQKVTTLHKSCEVRLDSGPGPTLIHALRDRRQFATVIQLSFLGWTHSRDELAMALAGAMTKRFAMKVPGASADPGFEGILGTLTACSSQTSGFAWSEYVNLVNEKLMRTIPHYYYQDELLSLTPAVLLGALDYLYLVQQLPEDRLITVSSAIGAITLTIWAHYILGLNVFIMVDGHDGVTFGNNEPPHLLITWTKIEAYNRPVPDWVPNNAMNKEPRIRLLDRDMSIVLEVPPELDRWTLITAEDRHTLSSYGTVYLHRAFNTDIITNDSDPIFKETISLATAVAIHASRRFGRDCNYASQQGSDANEGLPQRILAIEVWRILASSRMIFSGLSRCFDTLVIDSYVKFLSENTIDKHSLPNGCTAALKKAQAKALKSDKAEQFIRDVYSLATTILIFAHVDRVEDCGGLPVLLQKYEIDLSHRVKSLYTDLEALDWLTEVRPEEVLESAIKFLCQKVQQLDKRSFLVSYFGWSIFLHTVGDKDPGDVGLGLICIKKGTPTNVRTGERKQLLSDSVAQDTWHPYPEGASVLLRGSDYVPRAAAKVYERQEYWTTAPTEFSLSIHYFVNPEPEWHRHMKPPQGLIVEAISYREMHRLLWLTFSTTACDHRPSSRPGPVKLGPDAATALGWRNDFEPVAEPIPERILIFLTRGDPGIRWLAIKHAVNGIWGVGPTTRRQVMLRTEGCCDMCALEQAAAVPTRWILIL